MFAFRFVMISNDPGDHQEHDQNAKSERKHVVGVVRTRW